MLITKGPRSFPKTIFRTSFHTNQCVLKRISTMPDFLKVREHGLVLTRIQDVLDQNVCCILALHSPAFQKREATLHNWNSNWSALSAAASCSHWDTTKPNTNTFVTLQNVRIWKKNRNGLDSTRQPGAWAWNLPLSSFGSATKWKLFLTDPKYSQ